MLEVILHLPRLYLVLKSIRKTIFDPTARLMEKNPHVDNLYLPNLPFDVNMQDYIRILASRYRAIPQWNNQELLQVDIRCIPVHG